MTLGLQAYQAILGGRNRNSDPLVYTAPTKPSPKQAPNVRFAVGIKGAIN